MGAWGVRSSRCPSFRAMERLLAGLVAVAAIVVGPAAHAAPDCADPNVVNRWDGMYTDPPVHGVKATVRDRNIVLCTNDDGTSAAAAWIMVAGGDVYDYAQVGYARIGGMQNEKAFTEWSLSVTNWQRTFYSGIFDPGRTHDYHVYYGFSDGRVRMAADGQVLDISPSVDGHWAPGWTGVFFGETWDRSDNVPGNATNKTDYTRAKTLTCRGCSYGKPQGATPFSSLSVYKFEWVNRSTAFNIWTER